MAVAPLSLVSLFDGGGEPWLPLLKPTLESLDGAASFIGPSRIKVEVAKGFLGMKGRRMLFEVVSKSAVSIKPLSAFTGEEELVLAPGTRLKVAKVTTEPDGLTLVRLEEIDEQRLVA